MIDTQDATIRNALYEKEHDEREAEYSRQDYLKARATAGADVVAVAALVYAEAANKAHLAAERYEELVVDSMSAQGATVG